MFLCLPGRSHSRVRRSFDHQILERTGQREAAATLRNVHRIDEQRLKVLHTHFGNAWHGHMARGCVAELLRQHLYGSYHSLTLGQVREYSLEHAPETVVFGGLILGAGQQPIGCVVFLVYG